VVEAGDAGSVEEAADCTVGMESSTLAGSAGRVWTWVLACAGKDTIAADEVVGSAAEAVDENRDADRRGTCAAFEAAEEEVVDSAPHAVGVNTGLCAELTGAVRLFAWTLE
ncbi:MAG: hypothetical protein Q9179_003402, partial [Wetmoreana sp. 5 TL-2023]